MAGGLDCVAAMLRPSTCYWFWCALTIHYFRLMLGSTVRSVTTLLLSNFRIFEAVVLEGATVAGSGLLTACCCCLNTLGKVKATGEDKGHCRLLLCIILRFKEDLTSTPHDLSAAHRRWVSHIFESKAAVVRDDIGVGDGLRSRRIQHARLVTALGASPVVGLIVVGEDVAATVETTRMMSVSAQARRILQGWISPSFCRVSI
ncbi:hypothetical protein ACLOJK_036648 [Asimina triloba]